MDYYQGIVADFLITRQSCFVSSEFLIDLSKGAAQTKGRSWWVDILAVDFKHKTIFLCEVSYSKTLAALAKRLQQWSDNWIEIRDTLFLLTSIPSDWTVRVRIFTPNELRDVYERQMKTLSAPPFDLQWEPLEEVVPWRASR
jgi:hypothetical protein